MNTRYKVSCLKSPCRICITFIRCFIWSFSSNIWQLYLKTASIIHMINDLWYFCDNLDKKLCKTLTKKSSKIRYVPSSIQQTYTWSSWPPIPGPVKVACFMYHKYTADKWLVLVIEVFITGKFVTVYDDPSFNVQTGTNTICIERHQCIIWKLLL